MYRRIERLRYLFIYLHEHLCTQHSDLISVLDWRNVVAAGSSALLPLLPRRDDIEIFKEPAVESDLEGYYQSVLAIHLQSSPASSNLIFSNRQVASSSDIDLFVYGLTEKEAVTKIIHIESIIRKNQRLSPDTGMALRTENAITFVSPRWPYRHVQVEPPVVT